MTPNSPRNVYRLVHLVATYAHPSKRDDAAQQLLELIAKRSDTKNSDARTIMWHHSSQLPEGLAIADRISLGEYLTTNGYATS